MNLNKTINPTLIIATYNWKEALEFVLNSVLKQTVMPFEIIIADDGSTNETKELIASFKSKFTMPVIHVWHEDNGFRLAQIRNKAINTAKGNYIIQIDGDVILHKNFVKDHILGARKGIFLVGSRVLLGKKISRKIFSRKIKTLNIFRPDIKNKQYLLRIPFLSKLLKKPTNNIYKVIKSVRGCNMSFWKSDLLKINGYNEDMIGWGREDSEISARLIHLGLIKHKIKFAGIQYHIYHKENSREGINLNDAILENTVENNIVIVKNGINKNIKTFKRTKVTAIIPTFNEENNIEEAIKNIHFADEILIIDSFSNDETVAIAKKFNTTVIQRKFDDFSSQKNYAISQAKYDWIIMLDADERFSKLAKNEVYILLNNTINDDAYWMYRRNYFLGKQIKFSGWQNDKVIKFFNRAKAKYDGKLVHEEIVCSGKMGYLKHDLLHYTYKDKEDYKNKITLYSKLKAQELFIQKVKPNAYHFFVKPAYRFFYHYVIKLGFLDGTKGFAISRINAYGIKNRYIELKKMYAKSR